MSKMEIDQLEPPTLFAQCKIAIVRSRALSEPVANKLTHLIKSSGGEVILDQYNEGINLTLRGVTQIVASLADFRDYDTACDALIPVVKPDWVYTSLSKNKLANPRQHNPDPRLFLSDVVVCCADLPEGDKDAIIGGVLAMGGLHSSKVASMVTHIVALTMDSDKCRVVGSRGLSIKIVLPHWFDDCLKLGRRIDERPYLLPNPEILRNNVQKAPLGTHNRDITGACTPDPTANSADITPPISPRKDCTVFKHKEVFLSSDLGIGARLRDTLEGLIMRAGGSVTDNIRATDMYVGKYRDGSDYIAASRAGKDVGNLQWLYYMITNNTWTSPVRRLLHYPIAREGLPGFKNFRISLSNYSGEARSYLEYLVVATGAECTKTLKQDNTHLVTAHNISEKCQAAQDWGIHLINHLWLEESYAQWKLQSVTKPKYTHFPARTNLGEVVGQTKIDRRAVEEHFFPETEDVDMADIKDDQESPQAAHRTTMKDHIPTSKTEESRNKAVPQTKPGQAKAKVLNAKAPDVRKSGTMEKPRTPLVSRYVAPGKENETPTTSSSRQSKEVAVAKLHDYAPDIALYEKEKKRVGGVVYGGRRKSDVDGREQSRKHSLDADETTGGTVDDPPRKPKKTKHAPSMHLLITGFKKWVGHARREDEDKKRLRSLGIMVTQDPSRTSHLAAPSILRTQKFITALAYAPVIVSTDFIDECLAQDELLDPEDFLLTDKATEKKFQLKLSSTLQRAKEHGNELFHGRTFYCVENIHGGCETYQAIVEANGGKCLVFRGRPGTMLTSQRARSENGEEDEDIEAEVFLISGREPEQQRLWSKFRQMVENSRKLPKVVRSDWVLDTAMSQEIKPIDGYEFN